METNQLLIEAAEPLVMYLRKTCNPHVRVIVDQTGAELLIGELSTGTTFDDTVPKPSAESATTSFAHDFEPSMGTTSATKCRICGREKFLHPICSYTTL
jgi:hypothetical protein